MDPRAKEAIRDRKQFLWFLVALTLLIGAVERCSAAEAYYNPAGSPLPTKDMEAAIEYAAEHAWSQYIGVGAEYAGLTGEDEAVEGAIIVRWDYFPLPQASALSLDAGLVEHSADLMADSVTLANARWWMAEGTVLVKAVITINIIEASSTVDKCMYETIIHEFGHVFMPVAAHAEHEEDVMHAFRGDCRYSPSLSDLAMFDKPMKSCHVELTPHGDLEALDYNGKRLSLMPLWSANSLEPPRFGMWIWQSLYSNPEPRHCNGIVVDGNDIWAEVKGFQREPAVLRLRNDRGRFVSVPLGR